MNKQERSRRGCRVGAVEALETRSLLTIVATAPLPDVSVAPGAAVAAVDLDAHFKDANAVANSFATVNTSLGTIPVQLTPGTTPATVANFVNYANKGTYTNSIVHRSVPGFIWQAGGFQLSASGSVTTPTTDAPVKNEYGASNVRGTIAMAKLGSDPNSATDQFFFNETDNSANLNNQNGGFTVFGHVVGADGLAVMDAVSNVNVPSPGPLPSPFDSAPLLNYTSGQTVQPSNYVLIKNITTSSELFTVTSDAPKVAAAAVSGSTLVVNPVAAGIAHITVTGYGSDGTPATDTFTVNVGNSATVPVLTAAPTPTSTPTATPAPTPTPTSTATPTPTPTTTATPTPAAPPSYILPLAVRGTLPTAVAAGSKVKIQQRVTLESLFAQINQKESVALLLSTTTTGSPSDYTIARASARLKLQQGETTRLTLSASQIKATVPAGTYHVLVSVTDPSGNSTTVDSGRSLTVTPARSKAARK